MTLIAVVAAMDKEVELIRNLMTSLRKNEESGFVFFEGTLGGRNIVLMQSGIGKVNAACGVLELIKRYHPAAILSSGVAGGLDAGGKPGDIIIGKETVYHDVWCGDGNEYGQVQGLPARFAADEKLYRAACKMQTDGKRIFNGLICSGDKFITSEKERCEIKKHFPEALAADMESCAAAQTCYLYAVPFLSLRIISDTPGNTDDHALQYENFWKSAPQKSVAILQELLALI